MVTVVRSLVAVHGCCAHAHNEIAELTLACEDRPNVYFMVNTPSSGALGGGAAGVRPLAINAVGRVVARV